MKKKMNYSQNDLIKEDLIYGDAKVKVSMFLDGDLLQQVKAIAKKRNTKYQTLINQSLREVFLGNSASVDPDEFQKLRQKVEFLETLILKKIA